MQAATQTVSNSKAMLWTGRVLSALPILFLFFDAVTHIIQLPTVVEATTQLGIPAGLAPVMGTILLVCVILYAIPQTSFLGAVLLTGYLGGAIATNLRLELSLFGNVLFPVYVALFIWGGLYLRDKRLRALILPRR
ncbi:DoxX family protein [Ktedonospora formicarum]|uniref:Membrane protein n=1 Tax=Ktedonospora formicarum TaxID=2778364 RepID=A0A8J3IA41_9CHLR|nr:DoxX family protein [Ktedonospora formicarum]GHO49575.1 membrane protein [Ktedonospora formicarum]